MGPRISFIKRGELASLYSIKITSVFSGDLVYKYSLKANRFGVVRIKLDNSI